MPEHSREWAQNGHELISDRLEAFVVVVVRYPSVELTYLRQLYCCRSPCFSSSIGNDRDWIILGAHAGVGDYPVVNLALFVLDDNFLPNGQYIGRDSDDRVRMFGGSAI